MAEVVFKPLNFCKKWSERGGKADLKRSMKNCVFRIQFSDSASPIGKILYVNTDIPIVVRKNELEKDVKHSYSG